MSTGTTPIAEDIEQGLNGTERGRQAERRNSGYPEYNASSSKAQITSSEDFMTDILDAQQRLISAQHQFLHDNDLQALARAQLDVIGVQTSVLQRLGVYGPNI